MVEVFGGPPAHEPPADEPPNGEPAAADPLLATLPAGQQLTEEQRARWVTLAGLAAQEAQLPADPQFQAALVSYLDWVSRTAASPAPQTGEQPALRWDWTAA